MFNVTVCVGSSCHIKGARDVIASFNQLIKENGLESNLCLNCHQGRQSTVSVKNRIGELGDDEVSDTLGFLNVHYFAAGASLFGNEAQGAYEYDGNSYVGRNEHVPGFDTCVECHDTHALEVLYEECGECHDGQSRCCPDPCD